MAVGKGGNTVEKVRRIAEPIANELNLKIWDIRFVKEGASWFLRIFIDKDEGITIEDCENFSRAIDDPLDEADFISESYYLEVSSPGIARELTRPEHFDALMGQEIKVLLIRPRDGAREFEGELLSYVDDVITIKYNDNNLSFTKSEISKVRLNDDKDI